MLAELMYQLIYFLCAHPETGVPCQRYLRTNHDFFATHAARLPFLRPSLLSEDNTELFILLSNQQSWFMKTIAIEIKVASQTRLRSSMIRLLDLLYGQQDQRSRHDHFQGPCFKSLFLLYAISFLIFGKFFTLIWLNLVALLMRNAESRP